MAARPNARTTLAVVCCALALGCASRKQRIADARQAYYVGQLEAAQQQFERVEGSRRDVALLDRAMVALADGHPAEAESLMRSVRDRWRSDGEEAVVDRAVTLVTDESSSVYRGDDHERVLLPALLAISNLLHDGGDAAAYCEQFHQEQTRLLEKRGESPDARGVAVGAYLRGALKEATHRDYDAAQRAYATVAEWQPDYLPATEDIRRVSAGVHSAPGHGVVYVWALVNPGPQKVEVTAEATSAALLIAGELVSSAGDHTLPPTIAPVKITETVVPPASIDGVLVTVGDEPLGVTQTITDVAALAVADCEAGRDRRLAEAVARRVVKKAAVYAAKGALGADGGASDLALSAAGVLWEATESADTRCWSLLPGQVQVLRLELPAGAHELSLRPTAGGAAAGPPARATVEVIDGGNAYVLGSYPNGRRVGELLVRD